jgi:hypothetical protein
MTRKTSNPDLVPVFTPSLVSALMGGELEKGAPLTEQEVIAICEQSTRVLFRTCDAIRLIAKRGYNDVDPARCWEAWQKLRKKSKSRPHTYCNPTAWPCVRCSAF